MHTMIIERYLSSINLSQFPLTFYIVGTLQNCLGEGILMSTYKIGFHRVRNTVIKIIPKLSSNTHLIYPIGTFCVLKKPSPYQYLKNVSLII